MFKETQTDCFRQTIEDMLSLRKLTLTDCCRQTECLRKLTLTDWCQCQPYTNNLIMFQLLSSSGRDEYESEASDEEDEEARPLTREELQKRVLKTVKKREVAAVKDGYKYDLSVSREKLQKKRDGKKVEAVNW